MSNTRETSRPAGASAVCFDGDHAYFYVYDRKADTVTFVPAGQMTEEESQALAEKINLPWEEV